MPDDPSEADIDAYALAQRIPVTLSVGPMRRTPGDAFAGRLLVARVSGFTAIVIEDPSTDEAFLELRQEQVVSTRAKSDLLSNNSVEVTAKARGVAEDGRREIVVIRGPKQQLRQAFAAIGQQI